MKRCPCILLLFILLAMETSAQQWWSSISDDKTKGTFIDKRDNQQYGWVKIGSQVWMSQNLNVNEFVEVKNGRSNGVIIEKLCYNNKEENCEIYGGLYTDVVIDMYTGLPGSRSICPEGWHLPALQEWQVLTEFLGGADYAAGELKEAGTEHWRKSNRDATNSSGFTALPGGYCMLEENNLSYAGIFVRGFFWTSSEGFSPMFLRKEFRVVTLVKNDNKVDLNRSLGMSACSVRCVKD
jgi:uncharacterized protein (TIGR02145 family)